LKFLQTSKNEIERFPFVSNLSIAVKKLTKLDPIVELINNLSHSIDFNLL